MQVGSLLNCTAQFRPYISTETKKPDASDNWFFIFIKIFNTNSIKVRQIIKHTNKI